MSRTRSYHQLSAVPVDVRTDSELALASLLGLASARVSARVSVPVTQVRAGLLLGLVFALALALALLGVDAVL